MLKWMLITWEFVKKYYQIILLVITAIVFYIVSRGREISFEDELKKINDANKRAIDEIERARADEKRQYENNLKQLQETLAKIQAQYNNEKKEFDAKKRREVEELIKAHGDDEEELARKLSEVTGFPIILSK